jgi:predicted N-formylglutamate amidohydrolase
VPANADISDLDRRRRFVEIHQPLHEAIAAALDQRQASGKPLLLVSVHSFTPVMRATGAVRDFELGLLYNRDARLAERLAQTFRAANPDVTVKLNAPYHVDDISDYTIRCMASGVALRMCFWKSATTSSTMPAGRRNGQAAWPAPSALRQTASKETPDGR